MKYIYTNPVRVDLCSRVENYPYSTLRMKVGLSKLKIPLSPYFDDLCSLSYPFYLMDYCNEGYSEDLNSVLNKSLSKPIFKVSSRTKKGLSLEIEKEAGGRKK